MSHSTFHPETVEEVQACLLAARGSGQRVVVCGDQSKLRFRNSKDSVLASIEKYSGIVDHQASDFTITAKSGTPIQEVVNELDKVGQYLPFDPVFAKRGATVGGTVAAGLNGPCRLRYGGLRDFVIGCQLLDGRGNLIRGEAKLLKMPLVLICQNS